MTSFKLVIGSKTGKCLQKELTEEESSNLIGKKIKDTISGDSLGFAGYEFLITGGSDHCGFPMRTDIDGSMRKRIFAVQGVGLRKKGKGIKVRKTVCGNTIHSKTSQINLKVLKEGKDVLFEEKKEEKTEVKAEKPKEEVKKTEVKTEKKEEVKKEIEKKEEKPKEEKKETPKEEVKIEKKEEEKTEKPKEEVKKEEIKAEKKEEK